ncbi:ABC transporter substrate-binding protein [Clostridium sp. KNHs216]|uniref:ABC transporter substrate-binding protein n=1 Tax=Clostridium sp. KNHs216 TaxID=1550235 RepID=UPI0011507F34|nr:ABC transporter substrate-binding protein [Clostridium sp. KNHs216]TQI66827.1 ABC-type nitrate/sulfonate/bicarbonate transport system substrate-binding protein [Clostridium sp. KNHs216]
MAHAAIKEIHYTICPVGNSSYLAANRNKLVEGLKKLDVTPVLLQSLPQPFWKAHFDYQDPVLFREGGNIPPIWAKSNDADVVLIGLALLRQKQYILVRADSPIDSVEQLRDFKIGIPVHPAALIDFHRASAEHGFALALAARGVSLKEANFVEVHAEGDFVSVPPWARDRSVSEEEAALDRGEVDAIYVKSSRAQKLLDTGKYRVIFDIAANPSQLSPINNEYPNALTVSRYLAEEFPEVVTAYVKELLLAAEWAKTNREEALALLAKQTLGTVGQTVSSHSNGFYRELAPNLSQESLQALEGQKRFLYDHGYLKKDFDLDKWADDRFLKAALAEIHSEQKKEA